MAWTAVSAFAVVTLAFGIGDIIAIKTKGYVSSFIFTIVVFMLLGATLHWLPPTLIETAGLSNILVTYGMALTFINVGSSLKLNEMIAEWKTIVVTLGALVGVVAMCFTIGTVVFGYERSLAAIGTICGGLGATLVTSGAAESAGRPDIAIFVTTMMTFQTLVGVPIGSICLNRACNRFIADGRMSKDEDSKLKDIKMKIFPDTPKIAQGTMMYFAKLAIVGVIAEIVATYTGINKTVCYLLMGFLFTELGFLERGGLKKSGGESLVLLGAFSYLLINFLSLTFTELFQMIVPIFGLLILGAIAAGLAGILIGKLLGWNPWLSVAVGVTCLIGYPFTYGLALEAVNGHTFGKDYSEQEIQRLTNYVLPKMVIGGVTSVSIASVIIAAYIAPLIFK